MNWDPLSERSWNGRPSGKQVSHEHFNCTLSSNLHARLALLSFSTLCYQSTPYATTGWWNSSLKREICTCLHLYSRQQIVKIMEVPYQVLTQTSDDEESDFGTEIDCTNHQAPLGVPVGFLYQVALDGASSSKPCTWNAQHTLILSQSNWGLLVCTLLYNVLVYY